MSMQFSSSSLTQAFRNWRMESGVMWALCSGFTSFRNNETALRASALTYYTTLAIIPIFAIVFAISSGFGILADVDTMARDRFADHQQIYDFARQSAEALWENTSGGLITVVAIVFLLWTVVNILSQVEDEYNRIWRRKRGRSLIRRVTDYTALVILLPLLTVLGNGVTAWLLAGTGSTASYYGWKLIPTAASCLVIFLSYYVLTNKGIRFQSALIGAVVAGITYQCVQFLFIRFQVGVTTYNTLYGSFAAVPLFLVWVQVSWTIVLAGAELGYAWQHREERWALERGQSLTRRARSACALSMAIEAVRRFSSAQPGPRVQDFSALTGLPEDLVESILKDLLQGKILLRTLDGTVESSRYAPARPLDQIRVSDVLGAVIGRLVELKEAEASSEASAIIASLWRTLVKDPENLLLSELQVSREK